MKKIIGIKRVYNEADGSIMTDIDLTELKPIMQHLNELGVPLSFGMMVTIIEDSIQGFFPKETDYDYPAYTLISRPRNITGIEIITTKEKIDEVIEFGIVTAFRYCIGNELDFSVGIDEDEAIVASELYNEMWIDEENHNAVKNKFTQIFNPKGI